MKTVLLVALGGALGSVARYLFMVAATRFVGSGFPWGTLGVNIFGSFAIGSIIGILAFMTQWTQEFRAFAVVGVLGGFTTFSTFSLDALLLWEKGSYIHFALYIVGSVAMSLAAAGGGLYLIKAVSP